MIGEKKMKDILKGVTVKILSVIVMIALIVGGGCFAYKYYRSKISRNYWLFEPKCRNNAEITYTQRLQIASYFP